MTTDPLDPRVATVDDVDLIARIAAAGFYSDPVLSWAIQDPHTRLDKLRLMFSGLARDMVENGHVWVVDDSCVAMWRDPSYDHHPDEGDEGDDQDAADDAEEIPFDEGELVRLAALRETMDAHHPDEPHWYLNVISTRPEMQGRGLGAAVLEPTLARADAEGARCYLESTNPRNRTLYRRVGFVDGDEIQIPDGPTMLAMWRAPQPPST